MSGASVPEAIGVEGRAGVGIHATPEPAAPPHPDAPNAQEVVGPSAGPNGDRSIRFPIPFELWPPIDRKQFQDHVSTRNYTGRGRKVGPSRLAALKQSWGRLLAAEKAFGTLDDDLQGRASHAVLQRLVEGSAHLAASTIRMYLSDIRCLLHRFFPGRRQFSLDEAIRAQTREARRNKKPRTLRSAVELARLGEKLIADAERVYAYKREQRRGTYLKMSRSYRDGLLILTILYTSLRKSNASDLTVGTSLFLQATGATIKFPPIKMKNRRAYRAVLDLDLSQLIGRYREAFQPHLGPLLDAAALWTGPSGRALCTQSISNIVRTRTYKKFGVPLSVQSLRASGADYAASSTPQGSVLARRNLRHSRFATTAAHYVVRSVAEDTGTLLQFALKGAKLCGTPRTARPADPSAPSMLANFVLRGLERRSEVVLPNHEETATPPGSRREPSTDGPPPTGSA